MICKNRKTRMQKPENADAKTGKRGQKNRRKRPPSSVFPFPAPGGTQQDTAGRPSSTASYLCTVIKKQYVSLKNLKGMIYYKLKQNKLTSNLVSYEKWYAVPVTGGTLDLEDLVDHMRNHNCPYSKGIILAIITDMVDCVRELVMEAKTVSITGLCNFSVGIVSKKGCEDPKDFKLSEYVEGIRLRARAIGDFTPSALSLDATLKRSQLDPTLTSGTVTDDDDQSEFEEDEDDGLTHLED
jgi:nucleoid DNA-binding protein